MINTIHNQSYFVTCSEYDKSNIPDTHYFVGYAAKETALYIVRKIEKYFERTNDICAILAENGICCNNCDPVIALTEYLKNMKNSDEPLFLNACLALTIEVKCENWAPLSTTKSK